MRGGEQKHNYLLENTTKNFSTTLHRSFSHSVSASREMCVPFYPNIYSWFSESLFSLVIRFSRVSNILITTIIFWKVYLCRSLGLSNASYIPNTLTSLWISHKYNLQFYKDFRHPVPPTKRTHDITVIDDIGNSIDGVQWNLSEENTIGTKESVRFIENIF